MTPPTPSASSLPGRRTSRPPRGLRKRLAVALTAALASGTMNVPLAAQAGPPDTSPIAVYQNDSGAYSFEERAANLVSRMTLAEKYRQFNAASTRYGGTPAAAIPRLGVRSYHYWNEALHGVARVGPAAELAVRAVLDLEPLSTELAAVQEAMDTGRLTEGLYTGSSWEPFPPALAAAQAVIDHHDATQAQVDAALSALKQAVGGLVARGNTMGLAALVALIDASYSAADYTPGSWAAVAAALPVARALVASPVEASVSQVAAAAAALQGALVGLIRNPPQPTWTATDDDRTVVLVKAGQRSVTLVKGMSIAIPAAAYTAAGTTEKLTWKSSKAKIAQVGAKGKITARMPGRAVVTAKAVNGKSVKIAVTVRAKRPAAAVTAVEANLPRTMAVGKTKAITASYRPTTAVAVKVEYASSRPGVAQIDACGLITAKAPGRATITVKAGQQSRKYTIAVK